MVTAIKMALVCCAHQLGFITEGVNLLAELLGLDGRTSFRLLTGLRHGEWEQSESMMPMPWILL